MNNIKLFVAGDVMTGRGIDQILRHPSGPRLHEPYVKDALNYVDIAEHANGEIPRKSPGVYLWGDALKIWEQYQPDVKIVNLETAVTTSDDYWQGKGINYRMHPKNIDALTSAGFDICALANNHVMDWGYQGLKETLETLKRADILCAGAGLSAEQARAPAIFEIDAKSRVLVFSMGVSSSGIPVDWRATDFRPGLFLLDDLGPRTVEEVAVLIDKYKRPGDLVVASIHWGANWGYKVPLAHRDFAHALIDNAGVDMIHGHSSHHPLGMELHRGRPILYGCGDFINDYEGIGGREEFKGHLSVMYFLEFESEQHRLIRMEPEVMEITKFRLSEAGKDDRDWMRDVLKRESLNLGNNLRWEEAGWKDENRATG